MKHKSIITRLAKATLSAIIIFLVAAFLSVESSAQQAVEYRKGEVVVEVKPGLTIDGVNARFGTTTIQRIYGTNIYRVLTPSGKKEYKFSKKIAKDPDVLSAALNPIVVNPVGVFGRSTVGFPDGRPTPGQAKQSYLTQQLVGDINTLFVRSRGTGVIVAVIDTGIDFTHADIATHLWSNTQESINGIDDDGDGLVDDARGWDFLDNDNDPGEVRGDPQTSVAGHGTFIAGLIALVAPGAEILPVRAFDAAGLSDAFTVAAAIKYAADRGARVINLSFGSPEQSQVLHDAVSYARQRGALVVAAVGNDNRDFSNGAEFPAGWNQDVLSVAAIDSTSRKADFSNYGATVSVSAPGVRVFSLYPELNNTPDYAFWSGTSFAAPLAAAEAALILQGNPRSDARLVIESSATSIDDANPSFRGKLGRGRINPLEALASIPTTSGNGSEIDLLATAIEPQAEGKAKVNISGSAQEFEIEAEWLPPRAPYKIVVNGNVILDGAVNSKATATNFGGIKIEFSSSPSGDDLPLPTALNPVNNIRLVEVRDSLNRVVLSNSFGTVQTGGGEGSQSVEKEARLTATGVIANASGRARAKIESERESLRIEGEKLNEGASYEIIVDGVSLGPVVAQSGYVRVELTSDASSGRVLPASLRPVTKLQLVQIRNSLGQVVLQGSFLAGGNDFGSGSGGGGGGGGQDVDIKVQFVSNGIDDNARGEVRIKSSSSREELEIFVDDLDSFDNYTIVIDGVTFQKFMSDGQGRYLLTLSTETNDLPSSIRPLTNIRKVEILDPAQRVILTATLRP